MGAPPLIEFCPVIVHAVDPEAIHCAPLESVRYGGTNVVAKMPGDSRASTVVAVWEIDPHS